MIHNAPQHRKDNIVGNRSVLVLICDDELRIREELKSLLSTRISDMPDGVVAQLRFYSLQDLFGVLHAQFCHSSHELITLFVPFWGYFFVSFMVASIFSRLQYFDAHIQRVTQMGW